MPTVAVVLGTYNRLPYLRLTLDNIRQELQEVPHEIIVVDGGSTDGALTWLGRQKDVITIVQHNRGSWQGRPLVQRSWGYFMNLGFRCAQAPYANMRVRAGNNQVVRQDVQAYEKNGRIAIPSRMWSGCTGIIPTRWTPARIIGLFTGNTASKKRCPAILNG